MRSTAVDLSRQQLTHYRRIVGIGYQQQAQYIALSPR